MDFAVDICKYTCLGIDGSAGPLLERIVYD